MKLWHKHQVMNTYVVQLLKARKDYRSADVKHNHNCVYEMDEAMIYQTEEELTIGDVLEFWDTELVGNDNYVKVNYVSRVITKVILPPAIDVKDPDFFPALNQSKW
jgi:hypothetical protein